MTTTITPFTADGEFEETHCPFCSAKKLFSEFTGFKLKTISVAETDDRRSSSFAGLIASILLSKA